MARRRLDNALVRINMREAVCRDPFDAEGLALALLQKAMLFGSLMKQARLGLDYVEKADRLVSEHGLDQVAAQAQSVRGSILAAALRGLA